MSDPARMFCAERLSEVLPVVEEMFAGRPSSVSVPYWSQRIVDALLAPSPSEAARSSE